MRLFVAVDPDDAVRERIAKAVERMRAALGHEVADGLAWVKPESWHITLVFLGEIDDDVAAGLRDRFAAPFAMPAIPIVFGTPGLFPARGRPRVLWVGVDAGSAGLAALHDAVLGRLDDVSFRREARAFTPHLTLARVRPRGGAVTRDDLAAARVDRLGGCTVDHITLYRSRLSPKGAQYEALARGRLVAAT